MELKIFTKTKTGTEVKLFGIGVESESKNLGSDHLWFKIVLFTFFLASKNQNKVIW